MRWCRLYNETASDPKFRYIAATCGVTPAVVLGVWTAMLCHASGQESDARGTLKGWDCRVVAFDLGLEPPVLMRIRVAMEGFMLDGDSIISWSKRQFDTDTSRERTRAWRDRQKGTQSECDVTPTIGDVTPTHGDVTNRHQPSRDVPEQNRAEKSIVEAKASTHPKPRKRASGSGPEFDLFWTLYPRGDGKGAAEKAWARAVSEAGGADNLVFALRTQLDARHPTLTPKNGPEFVPHASTWLNQKRWLDGTKPEPADDLIRRHA